MWVDANTWGAIGSVAGAAAAIASAIAAFLSNATAKRSTRAAEEALRIAVKPELRVIGRYLQNGDSTTVTLTVINSGAGPCHGIFAFELEGVVEPDTFAPLPHRSGIPLHFAATDHLNVGDETTITLPLSGLQDYALEYRDSLGSRGQLLFGVMLPKGSDLVTAHVFILGMRISREKA